MNKNTIHVGVIGGGMAGLSATATLAEQGIKVTLFEAGSQLGGRARSVAVEVGGQAYQLDNGQHILLGAYRETLKLLAKMGVHEETVLLRTPLTMDIRGVRGKEGFKLTSPRYLPYPLNQLIGFLCCQGLSFKERLSAIFFLLRLKRSLYQINKDQPLKTFLKANRQSRKLIKLLWEPLCLAALNTPIKLASSKIFLNVLRDTFSGGKHNSDLLLPKLDLSQILSQPVARYLKDHQVEVLLNKRIRSIKPNEQGYTLETRLAQFNVSHVIIATPPARLTDIAQHLPKLDFVASQTAAYQFQPIYTVYVQYPKHVTLPRPMIGLAGTVSQWAFDRGALCGQHGLIAVIISATGRHQKLTQEALALRVGQELHHAFPTLPKPLWHKVIAEKRATFSCNVSLPRPANTTPYPNLFIAGDYTYADYPATIEGAVRSGINASNYIINP